LALNYCRFDHCSATADSPFSHGHAIVEELFNIVDPTVEHPLNVDFDFPAPCKTIYSLLRPHIPQNWFNNGEPLAINLPGFWRVDRRDHLL
jgi:hypothetical protein